MLTFRHSFLAETSDYSTTKWFAKITCLLINFKFLFEFVHKKVIEYETLKLTLFLFMYKKRSE